MLKLKSLLWRHSYKESHFLAFKGDGNAIILVQGVGKDIEVIIFKFQYQKEQP